MNVTHQTDDEQKTLWNGLAGRAWIEAQELLDLMFKPFEDLLVTAVSAEDSIGEVLDVGCGTGSITLAVARLLGAKGRCVGIDISDPMISIARARAQRESTSTSFICADAQIHAFEPGSFDMIISRFGVMFFHDFVRAFENLRRAAKKNAELRFICWRAPSDNPFMTTAERAAAPLLPNFAGRRPEASGQFALADRDRLYGTLEESGWAEIDILPIDVACTLPEKELVRYFTTVGPLGRFLYEADDRIRFEISEAIRPAFGPYVHGAEVRFTAACWMVGARASMK